MVLDICIKNGAAPLGCKIIPMNASPFMCLNEHKHLSLFNGDIMIQT